MYSECSRFHPNQFTFGGVIAERVNTAKSCPKVNPIFGGSYSFQPNNNWDACSQMQRSIISCRGRHVRTWPWTSLVRYTLDVRDVAHARRGGTHDCRQNGRNGVAKDYLPQIFTMARYVAVERSHRDRVPSASYAVQSVA